MSRATTQKESGPTFSKKIQNAGLSIYSPWTSPVIPKSTSVIIFMHCDIVPYLCKWQNVTAFAFLFQKLGKTNVIASERSLTFQILPAIFTALAYVFLCVCPEKAKATCVWTLRSQIFKVQAGGSVF